MNGPITIHISYEHRESGNSGVGDPIPLVSGMHEYTLQGQMHPIWMLLRGGWNVTWRTERK